MIMISGVLEFATEPAGIQNIPELRKRQRGILTVFNTSLGPGSP
jgi:hypothetical protein